MNLVPAGGTAETSITWLLWVAMFFFLLVVFIGWLTSRREEHK